MEPEGEGQSLGDVIAHLRVVEQMMRKHGISTIDLNPEGIEGVMVWDDAGIGREGPNLADAFLWCVAARERRRKEGL